MLAKNLLKNAVIEYNNLAEGLVRQIMQSGYKAICLLIQYTTQLTNYRVRNNATGYTIWCHRWKSHLSVKNWGT